MISEVYNRASETNQLEHLEPKITSKNQPKEQEVKNRITTTNVITTYNDSHTTIRNILRKNWFILEKDPYLNNKTLKNPFLTFRRAPTLKGILAPSKLKRHRPTITATPEKEKGS